MCRGPPHENVQTVSSTKCLLSVQCLLYKGPAHEAVQTVSSAKGLLSVQSSIYKESPFCAEELCMRTFPKGPLFAGGLIHKGLSFCVECLSAWVSSTKGLLAVPRASFLCRGLLSAQGNSLLRTPDTPLKDRLSMQESAKGPPLQGISSLCRVLCMGPSLQGASFLCRWSPLHLYMAPPLGAGGFCMVSLCMGSPLQVFCVYRASA